MHVYCDFDGTISTIDVTDAVLERYAPPEWRDIERAWEAGRVDARQCMDAQIQLIHTGIEEICKFLDTIEIDPAFPDFVAWCSANCMGVTVVSDGIDLFIRRVLSNHGLGHLKVVANRLRVEQKEDGSRYRLETPFAHSRCSSGAGVCKCAVVQAQPCHMYIGDGRSDFCVSANADMLFAKDKLAAHCERRSIAFFSYSTFSDIRTFAGRYLPASPQRVLAADLNTIG